MDLLTVNGNPKTNKSLGYGYLTGILHLAPARVSQVMDTCKHKTAACEAACLNTAGRGGIGELSANTVQIARIKRTELLAKDFDLFLSRLIADISKLERQADKLSLLPAVRLNGTSDIPWERIRHEDKTIFEWFPGVMFYDYTKYPDRCIDGIDNYYLTLSRTESNDDLAIAKLNAGENVAVVFHTVPNVWNGFDVIDGDVHDLRFLDPRGVVVGLKAKGQAKKDISGFVV